MPKEFAKKLLVGAIASLGMVACDSSGGNASPAKTPSELPVQEANCIAAEYGNKTHFCYITFDDAVHLAKAGNSEQYAVKAVLSLEFGRCVLHRDEFAARNYLDAESLWLKTSNCGDKATAILGNRQMVLVNVRGRLERPDDKDVRRAGALTDVVVFEEDKEPRR
jgi:hypothetical protein